MAAELEGLADLTKKLKELADPKEAKATLLASVRKPMQKVKDVAQANISVVSPGLTEQHTTYRGNLVYAGFASRSLRVVVGISKDNQSVSARLGVRREAFYALSFFELGVPSRGIERRPWLVPAFESSQSAALRGVGEELKKRIERIAKKRMAGK